MRVRDGTAQAHRLTFVADANESRRGVAIPGDQHLGPGKIKKGKLQALELFLLGLLGDVQLRNFDGELQFKNRGGPWQTVNGSVASQGILVTASEAPIAAGSPCALVYDVDGNAGLADASGTAAQRNVVGVAVTEEGDDVEAAGDSFYLATTGERTIADALWVGGVPEVTDVGRRAWLDPATPGGWTLTEPEVTGAQLVELGTVSKGGAGLVRVVVRIVDRGVIP